MRSIALLLFLASASLQDPNPDLKRFCLSPYIDSPSETGSHLERIVGDNCEQSFPYVATEEQQDLFCRSALPYDSEVIERSEKSFKCRWSATNSCPDNLGKFGDQIATLLFDKCFTLARSENCSDGFQTAKPSNNDDIRWISILFMRHEILAVESSRGIERQIMRKALYRKGILVKNPTPEEEGQDLGMITSRMSISELHPGQFIRSNDAVYDYSDMRRLCVKKSISLESDHRRAPFVPLKPQNPDPSFENGASHLRVRIEGGFAFPTRNSYLPQLLENGEVDVNHFHEICENICGGCYAATYESFVKHKNLPRGRYHVPVSRPQRSDPKKKLEENEEYSAHNKKQFLAKINSNNSITHIPKEEHWARNAPYMSNADMERLSVHLIQSESSSVYVDAPVYDYRPVMCIMGASLPPPLSTGKCYKYSEWDGQKCRCKKGKVDISTASEIAHMAKQKGYKEQGLICVRPQKYINVLESEQKYSVVAFVCEGIGYDMYMDSFDLLRNFILGLKEELQGARLLFKQSGVSQGGWQYLPPNPSDNEIIYAVNTYCIPSWRTNDAYTGTAISDVMWHKKIRHIGGKKLMFIFSGNEVVDADFMDDIIRREKKHFNWELFGVRMHFKYKANKDIQKMPVDRYASFIKFQETKDEAKGGLRKKYSSSRRVPYTAPEAYDAMEPS